MSRVEETCPHCGRRQDEPAPADATAPPCPHCSKPAAEPAKAASTAKSKGVRTLAVLGILLGTIAVAGAVIYRNTPEEFFSGGQAKSGPPTLDGAYRSMITIQTEGSASDPRMTVHLGRPRGLGINEQTADYAHLGLLCRELVRQAMLIAARDELGAATHDELLDDAVSPFQGGAVVELISLFPERDNPGQHQPGTTLIERRLENDIETVGKHTMDKEPAPERMVSSVASFAESLTHKEFPRELKKLGLKGQANSVTSSAAVPEKTDERQSSLSMFEHFSAIRDLHDAIRKDGESPERLGALARGYSMLGMLSEYHWNPAHRAFKARALLYAERQIAREPNAPQGYWNRAFVRTLVGMMQETQEDLDKAAAIAGSTPPPPWAPYLQACINDEVEKLWTDEKSLKPLVALLKFAIVRFPSRSAPARAAAQEVVSLQPECYLAHDAICAGSGLKGMSEFTLVAPTILEKSLKERLIAMPTLPTDVRKLIDDGADGANIAAALSKSEDRNEPSWSMLGHLIRETQFVHVYRRLYFMTRMLAVPADEFWTAARPDVEKHRYFLYLQSMAVQTREAQKDFQLFAQRLPYDDLEPQEYNMIDTMQKLVPAWHGYHYAVRHCEAIFPDLSEDASTNLADMNNRAARRLEAVAPKSAMAKSQLVQHNWASVRDKAGEWEKTVKHSPELLAAIALKYVEENHKEDAIRVLKSYVAMSPDKWGYTKLAEVYFASGDKTQWRATLDEYLAKGEDKGLDKANVEVMIANALMGENKFKEAKPYANSAAETWASWAIQCAINCSEGLKEWEEAAELHERLAMRYPATGWDSWYYFCRLHKRPELAQARALAQTVVARTSGQPNGPAPLRVGFFQMAEGDRDKAFATFDQGAKAEKALAMSRLTAAFADQLGKTERRDELIKSCTTELASQMPKSAAFMQFFRDWFADGAKKPVDPAALTKLIDALPEENRPSHQMIASRFLIDHANGNLARPLLNEVLKSFRSHPVHKLLAQEWLAEIDAKK